MRVRVQHISIPAMSTVGFGEGFDDDGNKVEFIGDHRPMRALGEAMQHTTSEDPIIVDLEDWQVMLRA